MPIYISRGRFTSDAIKGMLAKPENREEAVAKLFESVGGKLIGWYLTFGHHDFLVIGEFPDVSLSEVETTVAMTAKYRPQRRPRLSAAPGARRFARNFQSECKYRRPSWMPSILAVDG